MSVEGANSALLSVARLHPPSHLGFLDKMTEVKEQTCSTDIVSGVLTLKGLSANAGVITTSIADPKSLSRSTADLGQETPERSTKDASDAHVNTASYQGKADQRHQFTGLVVHSNSAQLVFSSPAKLSRGSLESKLIFGPVSVVQQQHAVPFSVYIPSSSYDFSAMKAATSAIEEEVKHSNPSTETISDRDAFMNEKAQHLKCQPVRHTTFLRILPLDIFSKLVNDATTCVAQTREDRRCQKKLWEPIDGAAEILEKLDKLNVHRDWEIILSSLMSLVDISLCGYPHKRIAKEELLAMAARMTEFATGERDQEEQDSVLVLMKSWLKLICKDGQTNITALRAKQSNTIKLSLSLNIIPAEVAASASDPQEIEKLQYIQKFSPFQPDEVKHLSVERAITKMLKIPLAEPELAPKYIYIYWSPGNFGYVKIGVTDDVSTRLRGWEKQCKHDVREHMQHQSEERIVVKYAYRVEKLIQTELKEFRFQEKNCKGCQKTHIEWFRTSPEHAARVIKKYSDWTASNPYAYDKRTRKWWLNKMISEDEIKQLCTPLPVVVPKSKQESMRKIVALKRGFRPRKTTLH